MKKYRNLNLIIKLGVFLCALISYSGFLLAQNSSVDTLDAKSIQKEKTNVIVKGLYKDGAIVEINGSTKVLSKGKTILGVKLISADTKKARMKIDGKIKTMTISTRVGAKYDAPAIKTVRIATGVGGHHWTSGFINGRAVTFVVDTGATSIAMSSNDAISLDIPYTKGSQAKVSTASGLANAYRIVLREVTVGQITVRNVAASVVEGAFPTDILLGNSFLSKVNMKTENGILILESKI